MKLISSIIDVVKDLMDFLTATNPIIHVVLHYTHTRIISLQLYRNTIDARYSYYQQSVCRPYVATVVAKLLWSAHFKALSL